MSVRFGRDRYSWWLAAFLLLLFGPAMAVLAGEPDARFGRTTLKVDKLSCGACLRVIDAELRKVPEILGLTADFASGQVTVDHDFAITPVAVAGVVSACGYPARVIETQSLPKREARLFRRDPGFGSGPGCCNPGGSNPVADSWRELRRRIMRPGRN